MPYCLQVISDPDQDDLYRWIILEQDEQDALKFKPHSAAECDFADWGAALNAGTLALAAAEGQPYENEASDPVGDADCSEAG